MHWIDILTQHDIVKHPGVGLN
uniref:Uncharacterized protein n=1 Tax=Rhizophora mucronata TaxID=61149 RepID=A0A2P2Q3Y7_RHIMU